MDLPGTSHAALSGNGSNANNSWQGWAFEQLESARKNTVGYIQRLISNGGGEEGDTEEDISNYYSQGSRPIGGNLMSWASMSAAMPKPLKQLQRSLTGLTGKGGAPDLPMTSQQAYDMSVVAQRQAQSRQEPDAVGCQL